MDAVTAFCNACLSAFETAFARRAPGSPLDQALGALGKDAFATVACEAMREHTMKALVDDAEKHLAELTLCGRLAASAMVAGVVSDTIRDIIARANIVQAA